MYSNSTVDRRGGLSYELLEDGFDRQREYKKTSFQFVNHLSSRCPHRLEALDDFQKFNLLNVQFYRVEAEVANVNADPLLGLAWAWLLYLLIY